MEPVFCCGSLLGCHLFVIVNEFEIASFCNIGGNEFAKLLSSVTMSVSQVVATIVSQRKAICYTPNTDTAIS